MMIESFTKQNSMFGTKETIQMKITFDRLANIKHDFMFSYFFFPSSFLDGSKFLVRKQKTTNKLEKNVNGFQAIN